MSLTMDRPTSTWETRPGWGIAVDLTPREVVEARHVRVHKRLIGLALLVLVALLAGVVLFVQAGRSSAQDNYDNAQVETAQLTKEARTYAVNTTMQRIIDSTKTQASTLMAQDVDMVNLVARIRAALPPELTLTTTTVLLAPPAVTPAPVDGATPAPATPQIIGTVSVSGTGSKIRQVTPFVSVLNHLRGVVDVIPSSITKSTGSSPMQFTLTMNITDELYTHKYDVAAAPTEAGVQ
jgi:hypothetical protein